MLVTELSLFGRMALASLFGFLIGFEREYRGKAAGERTFALLALGSAGFTAVGVELFPVSAEKVIAGVATGVGFIGAGIIWRTESGPAGLTTAASSWVAAAIGVLCGAAVYLSAGLATALTLLILESESLPIVRRVRRKKERPGDPGPQPPEP
ncbi:MAG: MgtC/SapB family protein [Actinobacteria bacterium]|nr:MgtC/SapB family protein [Actinomycetota bacterium]